MTNELANIGVSLQPASDEVRARVDAAEAKIRKMPQIEVRTEHVLHGGMYSRTVRLAARVIIVGVVIKVPTQLIVHGDCMVLAGDDWLTLTGYNVLPGEAGRKGLFITASETEITMIFPSKAKTVAEAEAEFTDDTELLLSREHESNDLVTITGS